MHFLTRVSGQVAICSNVFVFSCVLVLLRWWMTIKCRLTTAGDKEKNQVADLFFCPLSGFMGVTLSWSGLWFYCSATKAVLKQKYFSAHSRYVLLLKLLVILDLSLSWTPKGGLFLWRPCPALACQAEQAARSTAPFVTRLFAVAVRHQALHCPVSLAQLHFASDSASLFATGTLLASQVLAWAWGLSCTPAPCVVINLMAVLQKGAAVVFNLNTELMSLKESLSPY